MDARDDRPRGRPAEPVGEQVVQRRGRERVERAARHRLGRDERLGAAAVRLGEAAGEEPGKRRGR